MENDHSFIVGSTFEGAEGMFEQIQTERKVLTDEEYSQELTEREIIPDLDQKFEKTMSENSWELITDISENIHYPSAQEWIKFRIEHSRGTKFYPCFVKNDEGEVSFVKFQISNANTPEHGLAQEQHIYAAGIPEIVDAPALISDSAPQEDQLGYLEFEAISYEEGTVVESEDVTLNQCQEVARKIKQLEKFNLNELPHQTFHIPDYIGDSTVAGIITSKLEVIQNNLWQLPDAWKMQEIYNNEWFDQLLEFTKHLNTEKVLVHGDVARKNIIFHRDGNNVQFVDWEKAGIGFLGQDAGKFLNGLSKGSKQRSEFINSYAEPNDYNRLYGMFSGLILESLNSFAYRMTDIEKFLDTDDPEKLHALREKLSSYRKSVDENFQELNTYQVIPEKAVA